VPRALTRHEHHTCYYSVQSVMKKGMNLKIMMARSRRSDTIRSPLKRWRSARRCTVPVPRIRGIFPQAKPLVADSPHQFPGEMITGFGMSLCNQGETPLNHFVCTGTTVIIMNILWYNDISCDSCTRSTRYPARHWRILFHRYE
jgi:hypothetical protein